MRHDRPTIPDDLPPPWAVTAPVSRAETITEAAKRLFERAERLRARAKDIGLWDGRVRHGEPITLRADQWDSVAVHRCKTGSKPGISGRRPAAGSENSTVAATRLGVNEATLRSRALVATGSRTARPPAEWDALAVGMVRCSPRS